MDIYIWKYIKHSHLGYKEAYYNLLTIYTSYNILDIYQLMNIAIIMCKYNNIRDAVNVYMNCINLCRRYKINKYIGILYNNLGVIEYSYNNKIILANKYFTYALKHNSSSGLINMIAIYNKQNVFCIRML